MGSAMKRQLNYDLLLFHVREASQELESLLVHIRDMLGEPLRKDERELLYRGELSEVDSGRLLNTPIIISISRGTSATRTPRMPTSTLIATRSLHEHSRGSGRKHFSRSDADETKNEPFGVNSL